MISYGAPRLAIFHGNCSRGGQLKIEHDKSNKGTQNNSAKDKREKVREWIGLPRQRKNSYVGNIESPRKLRFTQRIRQDVISFLTHRQLALQIRNFKCHIVALAPKVFDVQFPLLDESL
jgi:hypothetical protein